MTLSATPFAAPSDSTTEPPPRFDLYAHVHKGHRAFMAATLVELGRMDCGDDQELKRVLDQLDQLLDFCAGHVEKENRHVHAAIEARNPGASQRAAAEHAHHGAAIDSLRADADGLARAAAGAREAAAARLYRQAALFVAENLVHMELEESVNNALLWASYSDAELAEIHAAIVAATSPEELALDVQWLAPSLRPSELAALMGGVQASVPAEVFAAIAAMMRPHLAASAWQRLATMLALPDPLSMEADADVVARFIDAAFVRFDAESAAALVTPDFVAHPWTAFGLPPGPAGLQAVVSALGTAFDEVSATLVDRLTDGDRMALRYVYAGRHVGDLFGLAATGRRFRFEGIAILRLAGGKVAEYWREEDMLGLQRQLGVSSLLPVEAA